MDKFDMPLVDTVTELTILNHNFKESVKNIVSPLSDEEIAQILTTDPFFFLYQFSTKTNIDPMYITGMDFIEFFQTIESEFNDIFSLANTCANRSDKVRGLMMFAQLAQLAGGNTPPQTLDDFVVLATEAKSLL
ncbi:predicted protein [Naegleria gruberi]|uniref:Predicted protein n=1 Tax=Naegleria gruberi TaxID=5762 RepID=D2W4K0_NAEGR|nr:uncharacterized protein NAEGRDRAFT_76334 [Naegleria gruberi]EFC36004.1 predicted protein [Naegleria gruberi]|eukprot:XP_002668748.1 predicted protein [Naegleria gruberi strain NEG-M]